MNKVLLAVDDSRGGNACVSTCLRLFASRPPQMVLLLHVNQLGGRSLVHDRISDAELATLHEDLETSGLLKELADKSRAVLEHHRKVLEQGGLTAVKTLIGFGHVADEIVKTAREEAAEIIIIGACRTLMQKFLMGNISKEVIDKADIPILLAK
jgi:nucleotide-binding universal stress UspA family protein